MRTASLDLSGIDYTDHERACDSIELWNLRLCRCHQSKQTLSGRGPSSYITMG